MLARLLVCVCACVCVYVCVDVQGCVALCTGSDLGICLPGGVHCMQVGHGRCRVEKLIDGHAKVLGGIAQQETFGEISFLQGEGATASVIADEDTVCQYAFCCSFCTDSECVGGDLCN